MPRSDNDASIGTANGRIKGRHAAVEQCLIYKELRQLCKLYNVSCLGRKEVLCKRVLEAAASLKQGNTVRSGGYAPEKYLEGLSAAERKQRLREIARGSQTTSDDASAYEASRFATDFDPKTGKRRKTKTSSYTERFYKLYPDAKSLKEKSEATGVPLDILQKVYDKGLAAYRTGHRPGATQGQWAAARVHSFLVKGCTFYFPDHKLAAEAMQRSAQARQHFKRVDCFCHKGCRSGSRSYK